MEESITRRYWSSRIFTKLNLTLFGMVIVGFLYRAIPHLFFISRWIQEEEYTFMMVNDLINKGFISQPLYYPILTFYSVFLTYEFFGKQLPAMLIAQYFNPLIGSLTVIPIYLLSKHFLSTKKSLTVCILWMFSEVAVYRSATFGTGETLAMFLSIFSLLFYESKKYVKSGVVLGISFISHLLPGLFVVLTIFLHQLLFGQRKNKIIACFIILGGILFLYSPLNTHQGLTSRLTPIELLSNLKISNFSLYSISELYLGFKVYFGTIVLLYLSFLSLPKIIHNKSKLMWSMFLASCGLFLGLWLDYNTNLLSPTRLMIYFIIPLSYFSVCSINWLSSNKNSKKILITSLILLAMFSAFINGLQPMLWVNDSLTKNENMALDQIQSLQLLKIPSGEYWQRFYPVWGDYPALVGLTSRTMTTNVALEFNDTVNIQLWTNLLNPYSTLTNTTFFKYVFISDRIIKNGLFINYTTTRNFLIHKPVQDIWYNSSIWNLIYSSNGVKLYEKNK